MLRFRKGLVSAVGPAALGGLLWYSGKENKKALAAPYNPKYTCLKDKTVLITGATAGIGESCAWAFAQEGSKLILIGRREARLQTIKSNIKKEFPNVQCHVVAMSVTDTDKVAALPSTLPSGFKEVDILVNNAGLALGLNSVESNSLVDAKVVLETNVLGVIAFCSAFIPGMIERGYGHVINMGSCAGRYAYAKGSMYNASKYAIAGFSDAARLDLMSTPVRLTNIAPGLVDTEFSLVRFNDQEKSLGPEKAAFWKEKVYEGLEALHAEDVADTVIYAATRPEHVNIAELLVYPNNQAGPRDIARVGPSLGKKSN
jgi:3-hydroxy acid dehydrogenase/malonic semialdehyde reductase